nr:uncharacterized protein LOC109190314 [Ipomoea batatas]
MKNIVVKGVTVILIPENDKSTSLDGEFDDSQFSSEDKHGNVVDTATTDVVEEFGNSIVQLNEIDCVDFEDELRSISSSFDVEGCNSNLVFSESKFNLEDFNKFQENMVFKDNKAFKWAVESLALHAGFTLQPSLSIAESQFVVSPYASVSAYRRSFMAGSSIRWSKRLCNNSSGGSRQTLSAKLVQTPDAYQEDCKVDPNNNIELHDLKQDIFRWPLIRSLDHPVEASGIHKYSFDLIWMDVLAFLALLGAL